MNSSKVAIVTSRIVMLIQFIVGGALAFFCGLAALVSMFDNVKDGVGMILFAWLVTLAGVLIFNGGLKRKKLIKDFKRYVAVISSDPTGSIENIARSLNTSQDVVLKNLQKMIDKKYFINAYINQELNCIVINARTTPAAAQTGSGEAYVTVTCKSCGGINKIPKNGVGECEYCGSPISPQ